MTDVHAQLSGVVNVAVATMCLVTVAIQSGMDCFFHAASNSLGTAKVAALFFAQTTSQVTSTALAMHALAFGRDTKSFLRAFMSLDLSSHRNIPTK